MDLHLFPSSVAFENNSYYARCPSFLCRSRFCDCSSPHSSEGERSRRRDDSGWGRSQVPGRTVRWRAQSVCAISGWCESSGPWAGREGLCAISGCPHLTFSWSQTQRKSMSMTFAVHLSLSLHSGTGGGSGWLGLKRADPCVHRLCDPWTVTFKRCQDWRENCMGDLVSQRWTSSLHDWPWWWMPGVTSSPLCHSGAVDCFIYKRGAFSFSC